jgi:predicted kinase
VQWCCFSDIVVITGVSVSRLAVSIVKDTGLTVVLDGTFLKSKRRNNAKKAALEHGVPFIGVWVTQESRIAPPKLSSGSSTDSDTGLHVRHGLCEFLTVLHA